MADARIVDITEDTTPDATDVVYASDSTGAVDKRVQLGNFPVSTLQAAADTAARAAAEATAAADATAKVAAEATLARNADNLTSGTVADARIASTIARDSEVTSAVAAEATARDAAIAVETSRATTAEALLAPKASPTFTGTVTLPNDTVTNAMSANMAQSTIKGRAASAGTGDPTDLTATQVIAVLGQVGSALGTASLVNTGTASGNVPLNSDLPTLAAGTRWAPDTTTTPGTAIGNVTLSTGIAGGDTLAGGSGSGEHLSLESTSHATKGQVRLLSADPTYTAAPSALFGIPSTRTITANFGTTQRTPTGIQFAETRVMTTAGNAALLTACALDWVVIFKNANGVAANLGPAGVPAGATVVTDRSTIQADGATIGVGNVSTLRATPTFNVINSGVISTGTYSAMVLQPTVGAGVTLQSVYGLTANDVANSGTVDEQVILNIGTLAGATVNIGIRNASTTVNTPTTKAITATSDTIPITASVIRLNNTSGSSKTLASAPTMADGQNGQIITLINTSANDVVIQDQGTLASSNLRLTATSLTLSTRDNVTLMYSSTVGDWVQITALVNVL